ncbi:MAG: hypothetical protein DMG57_31885 [Acidobacteria bacterium]|nr:MAG: hypothetical protein DMG57_31885 [Acidobacteriota bacterium]
MCESRSAKIHPNRGAAAFASSDWFLQLQGLRHTSVQMMRALILILSGALMAGQTVEYNIRPSSESTFGLDVYKTGLWNGRKHVFFFERYSGDIQYDSERPESARVMFVVEAVSMTCRDTWLKPGDRKKVLDYALKDMLVAEKYPQLTFASTRITPTSSNHFEATGNLTVRGITKPIIVNVVVTPAGQKLSLDGSAHLRLKDYGRKPPSAALGMIGTKDEMLVHFTLLAERQN